MEGIPMGKETKSDLMDTLERAARARKKYLEEHPEFLKKLERGENASARIATEHPETVAGAQESERGRRPALKGAREHDLHQRKILGDDF
ncbi:MAG: hypothetical protein PHV99_00950 [Candidatus Pacebacteria bacterium]|nr:hypothetical protein [Candidatus Paceibacterota bacterium]